MSHRRTEESCPPEQRTSPAGSISNEETESKCESIENEQAPKGIKEAISNDLFSTQVGHRLETLCMISRLTAVDIKEANIPILMTGHHNGQRRMTDNLVDLSCRCAIYKFRTQRLDHILKKQTIFPLNLRARARARLN